MKVGSNSQYGEILQTYQSSHKQQGTCNRHVRTSKQSYSTTMFVKLHTTLIYNVHVSVAKTATNNHRSQEPPIEEMNDYVTIGFIN